VFKRDERIKRHYARGACNQILFSSKTKLAFSALTTLSLEGFMRYRVFATDNKTNISYPSPTSFLSVFFSFFFFFSLYEMILMILPDCARATGKWANIFSELMREKQNYGGGV